LSEIRDAFDAFESAGAVVYGVNPFGAASHRKFAAKHSFTFPLLVDKGGSIAWAYKSGLWLMVRRTVYLIGPDGRVVQAWRGRPDVDEILGAIL